MTEPELIPLKEAAQRLGISKMTMARFVKEGRFRLYENPLDKREKLVEAEQVQQAARPRLLAQVEQVSKKAA